MLKRNRHKNERNVNGNGVQTQHKRNGSGALNASN